MGIEYRLWDSQWVNIVNSRDVLDAPDADEAVAIAVRMCEEAMAHNARNNNFPPPKNAAQGGKSDG